MGEKIISCCKRLTVFDETGKVKYLLVEGFVRYKMYIPFKP